MTSVRETKPPELGGDRYHAFIAHSSEDKELLRELLCWLKEKGFIYFYSDQDFKAGASIMANIEEGLRFSRRMVALVTPNFLDSGWTEAETIMAATKQCDTKKVYLIPLLHGVSPKQLPSRLRQVNCIDYTCTDWRNKLQNALCDDVPLTSLIPVGDIAHGLVWSYYFGFLNLVLPGLEKRIRDSVFWKDDRKFLNKMVVIIPESCYCPDRFDSDEGSIQRIGEIPYSASRGGHPDRSYKSWLYSVKDSDTGEVFYFVAEFASILLNVYEMEQSGLAGITPEHRRTQMKLFEEKMKEILSHPGSPFPNTTLLVRYRDPKSRVDHPDDLATLLVRTVRAELKKQSLIEKHMADSLGQVNIEDCAPTNCDSISQVNIEDCAPPNGDSISQVNIEVCETTNCDSTKPSNIEDSATTNCDAIGQVNIEECAPPNGDSISQVNIEECAPPNSDSISQVNIEDRAPPNGDSISQVNFEDRASPNGDSISQVNIEVCETTNCDSTRPSNIEDSATTNCDSIGQFNIEECTPRNCDSISQVNIADYAPTIYIQ